MRARVTFRLVTGLWITILAGLLLAVDSLAAPGGGSSGFGGGGGGGGGGGFCGGGGGAGSGTGGSPVVFLIFIGVFLVVFISGLVKAAQLRKRRRERARRVELASAEAAADDAYFAADAVKADTVALHAAIVAAWTGRDREGARAPPRARSAHRVGAAARRLRSPRLAQRVRDPPAGRPSSTSGSPTARTMPRTAWSSASPPCSGTW